MTINRSRNRGEENELFLKAFLLQQMFLGNSIPPFGRIADLSFGPGYPVPEWKTKYNALLSDYEALRQLLPKAPTGYKADFGINGKAYSAKYTNAAKSALVNHTARPGFKRVCEEVNADISFLDQLVEDYWEKREAGIIMEDISNADEKSPFRDHKEYFKPILSYFLFKGTGSKASEYQADFVLKFADPFNPNTYQILSQNEIVDEVWPTLVFSIRSKKGMPTSYSPEAYPDVAPWVRYRPGDTNPKGALHIRS